MKRAVKKTISPCNAKGRYAGKRYGAGYKFPERRKSSEDAKNWELQDSEFDGFYRKSNAFPGPVKKIDPEEIEIEETKSQLLSR